MNMQADCYKYSRSLIVDGESTLSSLACKTICNGVEASVDVPEADFDLPLAFLLVHQSMQLLEQIQVRRPLSRRAAPVVPL